MHSVMECLFFYVYLCRGWQFQINFAELLPIRPALGGPVTRGLEVNVKTNGF
jgi:hypothetical protein